MFTAKTVGELIAILQEVNEDEPLEVCHVRFNAGYDYEITND